MKLEKRKLIGTWLLVVGVFIIGIPIAYEFARYASDDFYRWVIRQPGFLGNLGSAPYLLGIHVFSFIVASPFVIAGLVMRFSPDD